MKRARVRITGLVQGVGFRWSLRERARSRGLGGWAANHADGSVEAVLEGEDGDVDSVLDWCSRGPSGAQVDHVETVWEEPRGDQGFHVH